MQPQDPAFWLLFELEGELIAVNPTNRSTADRDVGFLVGLAFGFHEAHPGRRRVFMSDLTQWLAAVGLDWESLDVDLASALDAIADEEASRPERILRFAGLSDRS
jgi:hypothetical protein